MIFRDGKWHRLILHNVWLMVMRATLSHAVSTTGTGLKSHLLLELKLDKFQFLFLGVVKRFRTIIVLEELALNSKGTDISVFHIIII